MSSFDSAALLDQAREATGLSDFGSDDLPSDLAVYTAALDAEARLSDLGRVAIESTIVAALTNRLRVTDWHRTHPEVGHEVIEAPVFVIGMFRAGTTLLSNLLDQDPENRSLLRWEAMDSVPPPTPAQHRTGPRVEASRAAGAMLDELNPAVRAIHHEDADGPTECIAVMSQDLKSLSWEAIANVPSYGAWLRSADQRSAYEYHHKVLQVLQSRGVGGRWMLKSPHHALALEDLISVYPDARLVLLHRDPTVLAASVCSLITTLSSTFSDADHRDYIAEHWTATLEESVRRVDAFRAAHPEHPITDVQYRDLVERPLATVEGLYEALGRELSPAARDAINAYVGDHPKGSKGAHRYDLASAGLDAADLAARFADYRSRYDIAPEWTPA